MKDIHDNSLFTDITAEEEVTVQGGAFWAAATAIVVGGTAFAKWASTSGNGMILYDEKNSWNDKGRIGKNMPQDLPNGWRWGIRDGGEWIAGGAFNSGNWLFDKAKKLLRV